MQPKKILISWEWIAVPILTTCNQFFMKTLAVHLAGVPAGLEWLKHAASTPWTAAVVVGEVLAFFLWMRVLSVTDVSRAVPLTAISYMLIVMTGWTVFNEHVLLPEIIGSIFILSGVWVLKSA